MAAIRIPILGRVSIRKMMLMLAAIGVIVGAAVLCNPLRQTPQSVQHTYAMPPEPLAAQFASWLMPIALGCRDGDPSHAHARAWMTPSGELAFQKLFLSDQQEVRLSDEASYWLTSPPEVVGQTAQGVVVNVTGTMELQTPTPKSLPVSIRCVVTRDEQGLRLSDLIMLDDASTRVVMRHVVIPLRNSSGSISGAA